MTAAPNKAAVSRWFAARVGKTIDTVQVNATTRAVWAPGPRTLARKGNIFRLDGSRIGLDQLALVAYVDADGACVLEWRDDDGSLIHTTTYREV